MNDDQLDKIFHALSDRTRRQMLLSLTHGELNISELGKPFGMTKQSVSKHLKVLQEAGLIDKQKDGRIQRCQFNMKNFEVVQTVVDQYREFWERQFDGLEDYIQNIQNKEKIGEKKNDK